MANQEPIDVTRAEIEPVSARDGAGQPKPLDRAPHDLRVRQTIIALALDQNARLRLSQRVKCDSIVV